METTATTPTATAQLVPYIYFYGRCEEALEYYAGIFGGTFEIMRIKDTPMADQMPESAERVMHASFTAPGVAFFASDGRESKAIDPEAGNISIALSCHHAAAGERIVSGLADGGTVQMPLAPAFWGGRFASVIDRFGNEWLITVP